MSAAEFGPELVEQAERAIDPAHAFAAAVQMEEARRRIALAVLRAVAPTLRAEGAAEAGLITSQRATGAVVSERQRCICGDICLDHCRACNYSGRDLEEPCIADPDWEPDEDDLVRHVEADERRAYQRGMAEGARQVLAAVKAAVPGQTVVAACEAVAHIEGGAS